MMNGVVIEFDKKHKFGFVIDENNSRYFLHKKTVEAILDCKNNVIKLEEKMKEVALLNFNDLTGGNKYNKLKY